MSTAKIDGNTNNILTAIFKINFTLWHVRLNIYIWKTKFFPHKQNLFRSSRLEVFFRKGALRNFAKFTGKYLCLRSATLIKKRLWHRYLTVNFAKFQPRNFIKKETLTQVFSVNFAKFLRTPFFTECLWWLLLFISASSL